MNSAWTPDVGPEEMVLLPEHHKHEQIKLFSAHATQAASQFLLHGYQVW